MTHNQIVPPAITMARTVVVEGMVTAVVVAAVAGAGGNDNV